MQKTTQKYLRLKNSLPKHFVAILCLFETWGRAGTCVGSVTSIFCENQHKKISDIGISLFFLDEIRFGWLISVKTLCQGSFHFLLQNEVIFLPKNDSTVPEFIDPVFTKASPKCSFSVIENERFGLVFAKTGLINSGPVLVRSKTS
jgi:hypothetical protein